MKLCSKCKKRPAVVFVSDATTTVANGVVNGGVYFEMAQDGITYKYSMFIKNDTNGAMVQLIEYNE